MCIAFWTLFDDKGDGFLSQQAMEDAIYGSLAPTIATVGRIYPILPDVTKTQKKAFANYIKFYTRDHADFPTKLR